MHLLPPFLYASAGHLDRGTNVLAHPQTLVRYSTYSWGLPFLVAYAATNEYQIVYLHIKPYRTNWEIRIKFDQLFQRSGLAHVGKRLDVNEYR